MASRSGLVHGRSRSDRLVLGVCTLATSLVGMDGMATITALPVIADGLSAGLSVQQWIVGGSLLALGALLLVGGALGDMYGRWFAFATGMVVSGLAAVLCALAPTATVLIIGRMLQGAGAALVLPNTLAILSSTFADKRRSEAFASWSAWSGLAVVLSPVMGGVLIDWVSWRAVYAVQIPCAILVLILLARVASPRPHGSMGGGLDVAGALLVISAVGGVSFFLIQGAELGWRHPLVEGALLMGGAALAGLVLWERRTRRPLIPKALFRERNFSMLNLLTFVLYGALISYGTYMVLFLQDYLDYPPALAGAIGAMPLVVLFILATPMGALADRLGRRLFVGGGAVIAGFGTLLLLRADADADLITVVLPSALVHGLGLAMLVPALTSGVMSAVPEERAGIASGINSAVARVGSLVAISSTGGLISWRFSVGLDTGLPLGEVSRGLASAIDHAREHPLSATAAAPLTAEERSMLESVLANASIDAFHLAVAVMGGLALVAGLIAFGAIRERPRPTYTAADTAGCPVTGMRTHPDAAQMSTLVDQPRSEARNAAPEEPA